MCASNEYSTFIWVRKWRPVFSSAAEIILISFYQARCEWNRQNSIPYLLWGQMYTRWCWMNYFYPLCQLESIVSHLRPRQSFSLHPQLLKLPTTHEIWENHFRHSTSEIWECHIKLFISRRAESWLLVDFLVITGPAQTIYRQCWIRETIF